MSFSIFTFVLTAASLVGVWLNIKKNKVCFYIWSGTNFSWAAVDFVSGLFWQGVLFSIYFVLAIYGVYEWRKHEHNI
jgi:hypothetical protein